MKFHCKVDSSAIHSIRYNSKNEVLRVKFQNGATYFYGKVPVHVAVSLAFNCSSVGSYFNHVVRNVYPVVA